MIQLLQGTDAPIDVFLETIAAPLIDAVMSLQLQWGCSTMAHGQNLHLEFLPSGRPSGRGLISDLQNVWEHPALCPRLGLSLPDDADYRAEHRAAKDADIAGTFQDYFLWKVMQPLLLSVERHLGEHTDLRPRTNGLIAAHVLRHADLVEAAPELWWFRDTYLR